MRTFDLSKAVQKADLVVGGIYRLSSRNLVLGAYDGAEGFIGIRTKFGDRFLFTEYLSLPCGGTHFPHTTATPYEQLGSVPEGIPLKTSRGTECFYCHKPARWPGKPGGPSTPWLCEGGCAQVRPVSLSNEALFKVLDAFPHEGG